MHEVRDLLSSIWDTHSFNPKFLLENNIFETPQIGNNNVKVQFCLYKNTAWFNCV